MAHWDETLADLAHVQYDAIYYNYRRQLLTLVVLALRLVFDWEM